MGKFIDLRGQKFCRLTAVEYLGGSIWRCLCDCGNETRTNANNLRNGSAKSCGCYQKERARETKLKDLTGQKFGMLTVEKYAGNASWECTCDCGNKTIIRTQYLKRYKNPSCGCIQRDKKKQANLTGRRFGRLVVLKRVDARRWLCRCDCGNTTTVHSSNLHSGTTRSCGCLKTETTTRRLTTHGGSHERLHTVWNGMKQRCTNPKNKSFENYGGRGITVCKEWMESYECFRKWALSHGYDKDAPTHQCSIERIDNNKGYSPENCKWATASEQNRNTRKRRMPSLYRPVNMLDEAGNVIRSYDGITLAAEDTGLLESGIGAVCRGIQKTTKGTRWEYAETKAKSV